MTNRSYAAAYRSGTAAYRNGKPLEANPYNKTDSSHFAWMIAWSNEKIRTGGDPGTARALAAFDRSKSVED